MNNNRFPMYAGLIAALAFAAIAPAYAAGAKTQMAANKTKTAQPAKPVGQVVEYTELESRVGQTLVIETTFKTTRTGKLVKYTQPVLTLDIGTEAKPMELSVPKETIKTITVITPAATTDKDAGTSGAKKN
jgi:hypothetical protein